MPELPEVETIRLSLAEKITGDTIKQIEIRHPDVLINPDQLPLARWTVQSIRRRGKYLMFDLSSADKPDENTSDTTSVRPQAAVMIIHLRMTGKLMLFNSAAEIESLGKHTHLLFPLDSGRILAFHDVRRFGRVQLYPAGEETRDRGLAALGPEPLSEDFTADNFIAQCKRWKNSPIKSVLLNQQMIAGLGNIYADESLFRAGIRPQSKAGRISRKRLTDLHRAIRGVLKEAIGHRGTSFRDYVDGLGQKGFFQLKLAVYQRTGQACPHCGNTILRIKVAGRSTHYCPCCQKN